MWGDTLGYSRSDDQITSAQRRRKIRRVLWIVLVLNVGVAVAKLAWGTVIGSVAMQADGFHSLFDGASNVVGLVGLGMASRPPDSTHPYGHSKYETYASAAIGAMLAIAAYNVGSTALRALIQNVEPARVDAVAFAVMIVTLSINISVTLWERRVGRRLKSEILLADARHTLSDVLVSLGVIVSLIAVKMGMPVADPIVGLLVAGAIAYTAWQVFSEAASTLSDSARIPAKDVRAVARQVDGVLGCHHIRTRGPEAGVYVDMHVQVDASLSMMDAHKIAEDVEREICAVFDNVADVLVHVEPYDQYQADKTAEEIDAERV